MSKKINIIFIGIILIILLGSAFLSTGSARTDVYLKDFKISEDEKKMILEIGISSSSGYVRKMKRTSGSMNYYFTFYSTFGINSKLGAKDTFEIELDSNADEIYFYTGDKGYKKVLEKTEDGKWVKPSENEIKDIAELNEVKGVTMTIKEGTLTRTGATIIITDLSGKDNVYGNWYRIDKKENGIWQELDIIFEGNYGCNLIGYSPNENNQLEMDVNWEDLYGKLESGEYRLVKETSIPLENQKYYFSVEFVLK